MRSASESLTAFLPIVALVLWTPLGLTGPVLARNTFLPSLSLVIG